MIVKTWLNVLFVMKIRMRTDVSTVQDQLQEPPISLQLVDYVDNTVLAYFMDCCTML